MSEKPITEDLDSKLDNHDAKLEDLEKRLSTLEEVLNKAFEAVEDMKSHPMAKVLLKQFGLM